MVNHKSRVSISVDDGHPLDLKAAEILAKKNLEVTFYIPIKNSTGRPTMNKKQIKYLSSIPNVKIGGHTYNHKDLTKLSLEEAREEIRAGREELENITGKKIASFSWPWGKFNGRLLEMLKEMEFQDCRGVSLIDFRKINDKSFLWYPNLYITRCNKIQEFRHILKKADFYSLFYRFKYKHFSHLDLIKVFQNLDGHFDFWFHSWELEELGLWEILRLI